MTLDQRIAKAAKRHRIPPGTVVYDYFAFGYRTGARAATAIAARQIRKAKDDLVIQQRWTQ